MCLRTSNKFKSIHLLCKVVFKTNNFYTLILIPGNVELKCTLEDNDGVCFLIQDQTEKQNWIKHSVSLWLLKDIV